jgi:hypothetical protein
MPSVSGHLPEATGAAGVVPLDEAVLVLALSAERDLWHGHALAMWRDGYDRGVTDGRAAACVNLAVMEEHREKRQHWNDWWAKVARIIRNFDSPATRMSQVMAEIAADQKLVTDALVKAATKPRDLSPLESCVLSRIRGERLDESEAA